MKLWLISANTNWLDSYDSAVVAAKSEDDAKNIHPSGGVYALDTWVAPAQVTATPVGSAIRGTKAGTVICASFNAG